VGRLASVMKKKFGLVKGDRVLLYLPMIPASVFTMLACARIGAIHSVVFGGFAARELASRIDDCEPKLVITASCGLEPGKVIPYRTIVDEAFTLCHKVKDAANTIQKLILQRKDVQEDKEAAGLGYLDYDELMAAESEIAEPTWVEAPHPLYILCNCLFLF